MALRTPISRVRCVTDISMMFNHADAPTEKSNRADSEDQTGYRRRDLAKLIRNLLGAGNSKIIGLL